MELIVSTENYPPEPITSCDDESNVRYSSLPSIIAWLDAIQDIVIDVDNTALRVYAADKCMPTDGLSEAELTLMLTESGPRKQCVCKHLNTAIRDRINAVFELDYNYIIGHLHSQNSALDDPMVQNLVRDLSTIKIDAGVNVINKNHYELERILRTLKWTLLEIFREMAHRETRLDSIRNYSQGEVYGTRSDTAIVKERLEQVVDTMRQVGNQLYCQDCDLSLLALAAQCQTLLITASHTYPCEFYQDVNEHDSLNRLVMGNAVCQYKDSVSNVGGYTKYAIAGMQPGMRYPVLGCPDLTSRVTPSIKFAALQYAFDEIVAECAKCE